MRNISFSLTTRQVRERSKTVTRRLRWLNLQPGTVLQGCEKCMGRRNGEPLVRVAKIRVVSVRRERLDEMLREPYGRIEASLEGFPNLTGKVFVEMFCREMGVNPDVEVTRIEFAYLEE